jgi:hypothetical protein
MAIPKIAKQSGYLVLYNFQKAEIIGRQIKKASPYYLPEYADFPIVFIAGTFKQVQEIIEKEYQKVI